jgi:hypothetical protein
MPIARDELVRGFGDGPYETDIRDATESRLRGELTEDLQPGVPA